MNSPIYQDRQRFTRLGVNRITNLRRVIEALRTRNMRQREICDLINYSLSGVGKFTRELLRAHVIVVVAPTQPGRRTKGAAIYGINKDEATVARYLELLNSRPLPLDKLRKPAPALDPGRHIHVLHDDNLAPLKVGKVRPVAPDTLALPAGFFGVAGKGGQA